jgi:hypothetical protein
MNCASVGQFEKEGSEASTEPGAVETVGKL